MAPAPTTTFESDVVSDSDCDSQTEFYAGVKAQEGKAVDKGYWRDYPIQ